MPGVPGEHGGITAIHTQIVVRRMDHRDGDQPGKPSSSYPVQYSCKESTQGSCKEPLTIGLEPFLGAPHSASATPGEIVTVIRGSFVGVWQWGSLSSREPSPPYVWREKNYSLAQKWASRIKLGIPGTLDKGASHRGTSRVM